jgi:hypothetical protein
VLPRQPATVQLLVHGASYDHLYWNFPYGGGYYSYVDAATAAGYANNCASAASVRSYEAQYYQPAAHLKLVVIPGTGHDLALSTTAPLTDAAMIAWSLSVIAP